MLFQPNTDYNFSNFFQLRFNSKLYCNKIFCTFKLLLLHYVSCYEHFRYEIATNLLSEKNALAGSRTTLVKDEKLQIKFLR